MNILSKEDLEIFSKHEREFYTSINHDYKRNTSSRDCLLLAEIYEKTTNIKVTRNFSCGSCQMTLFKQLGNLYYDSVNYYKEQAEKEELLKNTKTEEVATEPEIKKKARKNGKKK